MRAATAGDSAVRRALSGEELYLDLMERTLTNLVYRDPAVPSQWRSAEDFDILDRATGLDWPSVAHTMIGVARLANVRACVESTLHDNVPGDFVETGVWRGGTCIFMRAVLAAHHVRDRTVWLADSYAGMPLVGEDGDARDRELALHRYNDVIAVSMAEVAENFSRYGLLDEQVRFLPGWFHDSLPLAPVERIAVLRLDGDLYSSTMDALVHLYPKVSLGGYVIVDDYLVEVCRQAVADYREEHAIDDPIEEIDGIGVYWRKAFP